MPQNLREKLIEILILFKSGNLTNEERYADQILSLIMESLPEEMGDEFSKIDYQKAKTPNVKGMIGEIIGYNACREEVIKMLKGV